MLTVSDFLINRLSAIGVGTVFGLPGDYVLGFYDKLWNSGKIEVCNTTCESHAGFAADAYSRIKGIGCVCVTYSVGGLKLCNAIAGAYAEKSPVIVISGSPGMKERDEKMILHHVAGSFQSQKKVFENYTCASTILSDPRTAAYEIDRVLNAVAYFKQPGYIELPRDIAETPIVDEVYKVQDSPKSDQENLTEALLEIRNWIQKANYPVIIAGVEIARYGLGKKLIEFAEATEIPICTTLLSKSVVGETHPLFAGVFTGAASNQYTKDLVEGSDCLLMFGVMLTDMALSFNPKIFNRRQTITCSVDCLKVSNHSYTDVLFADICENLFGNKELYPKTRYNLVGNECVNYSAIQRNRFQPQSDKKITVGRFFQALNSKLLDNMAIIADVGDSLFGASDLVVNNSHHFLGSAFYTSMGFAIPGALGAQKALKTLRPIVIVGDGAFQMSCTEMGTIAHYDLNPIVFILNNRGFTTERYLKEGSYNDIPNWSYTQITSLIGKGISAACFSEADMAKMMDAAIADKRNLWVIEINLEKTDISPALARITEGLSKRLK